MMVNLAKDLEPVVAPLRDKLQANGYRIVTQADTLRQLLAQPSPPQFLYADIVCYQEAGAYPTVVFAVRDTLSKPWFVASESTAMFITQQKALIGAARHLADRLPATFAARFGTEAPADRGPQFMAYNNLQFTNYLEAALTTPALRQQLKQGAALELTVRIDALGFAALQAVDEQVTLDTSVWQALEAAVRNTPPWGPAYQNGRRTAAEMHTTIGQAKR